MKDACKDGININSNSEFSSLTALNMLIQGTRQKIKIYKIQKKKVPIVQERFPII